MSAATYVMLQTVKALVDKMVEHMAWHIYEVGVFCQERTACSFFDSSCATRLHAFIVAQRVDGFGVKQTGCSVLEGPCRLGVHVIHMPKLK